MPFFSRFSIYFEEVARQASIRKAADRLNIAASAIDRHILNAEEALGTPLFERLPTGLRLTTAGELAIHSLRRWQGDYKKLRGQIEDLKGARRGEVVIAVADGLAPETIPTAIMTIRESLPRVKFRVIVSGAESVATLVRSGECDIGLTFDPVSFAGLSTEYGLPSRLGVLSLADHPVTRVDGLRLSDCVPFPIVAADQSTALWRLISTVAAERKIPLDIVFSSNNVAMLCEMVLKGIGIGLMRDLDALAHIHDDRFAFTPLIDPGLPVQNLSLIVARGRQMPAASSLLIEHLTSLMRKMEEAL